MILNYVSHENILRLIVIDTARIPACIATELMVRGDLRTFLRAARQRTAVVKEDTLLGGDSEQTPPVTQPAVQLHMCFQVGLCFHLQNAFRFD